MVGRTDKVGDVIDWTEKDYFLICGDDLDDYDLLGYFDTVAQATNHARDLIAQGRVKWFYVVDTKTKQRVLSENEVD